MNRTSFTSLVTSFDIKRAAVLGAAVGVARLHLRDGKTAAALATLDEAAAETHRLFFDALVDAGFEPHEVEREIEDVRRAS